MPFLQHLLINHFVIFTLVLARTSGLFLTAPLFSSVALPTQLRVLLIVATSVVLTPTYWGQPGPGQLVPIDYALLAAAELGVGASLGLGVAIVLGAMQVMGQIVGQLSGMSLADIFDPAFDASNPVFGQLMFYIGMAVFLLTGGHRLVLAGLLDTFAVIPPGAATLHGDTTMALVDLISHSFVIGIQASAPLMAALLVATLVLGLISRTLPQLNVLVLGFGLNSLIVVAGLMITLGGAAWLFADQVDTAISTVQTSLLSGMTP